MKTYVLLYFEHKNGVTIIVKIDNDFDVIFMFKI